MRAGSWLLLTTLGLGCASAPPVQKEPLVADPSPRPQLDPAAYAARYTHPLECEAAARALQPRSRDEAWRVLQACVAHGDFFLLHALLSPDWLPDLQTRPEAPAVLTRVIAARGGDVDVDVHLLHQQRVPMFTLKDGLAEPELYQGRLILVRGRVDSLKKNAGQLVAMVSEVTLESEPAAPRQVGVADETRHSGELSGHDRNGPTGREEQTHHWARRFTVPRWDNVSVDTGLDAIATLDRADPFFEPGEEFLLLARFEGVEAPRTPGDSPLARITVLQFERPASLLINN